MDAFPGMFNHNQSFVCPPFCVCVTKCHEYIWNLLSLNHGQERDMSQMIADLHFLSIYQ